ncbi:hypothetical protein, partial [Pyrobaculum sp.]|uniref:hypothetical protein n=1 Tax=Pyrobaculum sp. TaxID=2004705 RepID=UPI003D0B8010
MILNFDVSPDGFVPWMMTDEKTYDYYTSGLYQLGSVAISTRLNRVYFCSSLEYDVAIRIDSGVIKFKRIKDCLIAVIWRSQSFSSTISQLPLFTT